MLNIPALEPHVAEQMATHRIPGLALAVVHDGQVIYTNGFGVTSVEENGIPVTPRTLFRIGSTTKPLAGTAIMRLVEAGRLNLDTPVATYFPGLRFSRPGAEHLITLRMLLTHTSGLGSLNNPYGSRDPETDPRWLSETPFVADPGKVYSYSNPGVALAGCVAAAVYGKPVGAMVKELVFDPLGMDRSTFDPMAALTHPFAFSHHLRRDSTLEVVRPVAESTGQHAAGFAMSNVLEMARFALLHMSGEEALGEMHQIQADKYTTDGSGYGLTFHVSPYKGLKRVGHGGGIHHYQCSFDMLPEAGTAVIIMTSRMAPPGVHQQITNDIFDQLLGLPADQPAAAEPAAVEPDRSTWPGITGLYLSPLWGLLAVAVDDGQLILHLRDERLPLQAHSDCIYFSGRHSVGCIPGGYLLLDGCLATRFAADLTFVPDRAAVEHYAGGYLSPVTCREDIRLWIKDDQLWAKFVWYPGREFPCIPLNSNTHFASGGGVFCMVDGALEINGWRLPKG